MRLFLHSGGYFLQARDEVLDFLGDVRRLVFVPYAAKALDRYTNAVREKIAGWGVEVVGIHEGPDPHAVLAGADALFMGGGNTFLLVDTLVALGLTAPIRERVHGGMPYMGSSAGSNMACPTIMTTNDMPIVYPPTFEGLGLIPFQINPHYVDPDPESVHQGETRATRIREYHEVNHLPVIGLREGSLLRREGVSLELRGSIGARLFRRGQAPVEHVPGDRLDALLECGQTA